MRSRHRPAAALDVLMRAVGLGLLTDAPTDLDDGIDQVLAGFGQALGACRAYVFVSLDGGVTADNTHEWCRDGVTPEIDNLQRLPTSSFSQMWERLAAGEQVVIDDVDGLPASWSEVRELLAAQDIVSLLAAPMTMGGRVVGFVGFDVTDAPRRFAAAETATASTLAEMISRSIERGGHGLAIDRIQRDLRGAFDAAPIGMALLDADGRFLRLNPALATLLGQDADAVVGQPLASWLAPDDLAVGADRLGRLWSRPGERVALDLRLGPDRVEVQFDGASYGRTASDLRVVVHVQDLRERRAVEAALAHSRLHDPLTLLPNRAVAAERVDAALRADGDGHVGVLCLDLDRFRVVNDQFGHVQGDRVLGEVAGRLSEAVPADATVARLGADEFVVVLPSVEGPACVAALAESLRSIVGERLEVAGRGLHLSATVGATVAPVGSDDDGDLLLQRADMALHRAREDGRPVALLDAEAAERLARLLDLETELAAALHAGELDVAFQPVHAVADGQVVGVEALLRWPGADAPIGQVIEIAERSTLIIELGRYAMRAAVRALPALSAAAGHDLALAVNLSARQLHHDDLVDDVAGLLADAGLTPSRLCIELTETAAMADPAHTVEVLGRLRELGVRISIDDFGTGYSSFSYLRDLPVDEVKLDRSFLVPAPADPAAVEIIIGMVRLCQGLGLEVVGEGVEELAQLDVLDTARCTRWQGYLSTPPLAVEHLVTWLAQSAAPEPTAATGVAAQAAARGWHDVLVFQRVHGDRFAHVGGIGRGEAWAGIVEVDLGEHASIGSRLGELGVAAVSDPAGRRVVGPYHARSAVVVRHDDALVVLGNQHEVVATDDVDAARTLAARAVAEVEAVSPARPLADELEVLEAVQHLLRFDGETVADAAGHLAEVAATALSCEIAVVATPRTGLVAHGVDPQDVGALADLRVSEPLVVQEAEPGDLPGGLVGRLAVRSWVLLPLPDAGWLLAAHTAAAPRGFTSLCQRLGRTLVERAEAVLRAAATREDLADRASAATAEARRDPLTGVANRLAWDEAVEAVPPGSTVGVVVVDVDDLRGLNDRHGRATGDRVLRAVAAAVRLTVDDTTLVARFGSDEVAVLVVDRDPAVVAALAEVLRQAVAAGWADPGVPVHTSVGAATAATGEEALRLAEARLARDGRRTHHPLSA